MATLYQINDELARLLDSIDGDELPEGFEAMLDALDLGRKAKVEALCQVVQERQAKAAIRKAEADRLMGLMRQDEQTARRLKDYLQAEMERMGEKKIETELFVVRVCKNGTPSVLYDDLPETLPAEFQRVRVEIDKGELAKRWRAGAELPPGVVVIQGNHLRIT